MTQEDRVGLIGGVGDGNTGNEVSLDVVRDLLHAARPDLGLAVITPSPEGARERGIAAPGEPVLPFRAPHHPGSRTPGTVLRRLLDEVGHLGRVWRSVGALSGLVVCGTGVLDDFEEPPWGMPWALFLWAAVAKVRGRPFVLLSVGAGPISGRVSARLFRATVVLSSVVTYRDAASRDTMDELGAARDDARVTCDLAFGRAVPPAPAARPGPGMRVAVAVMDWAGWSGADRAAADDYLGTLAEVVAGLLDRGHRVQLLVGQPVDVPPADEVRRRVADRRPGAKLPLADVVTFDDLVAEVQAADLVVATRFHTVVAALMTDRPVISVAYAHKNRDLLARVGVEHANRPIGEADATWVLDHVDAVAREDSAHRGRTAVIEEWGRLVAREVAALATRFG